MTKGTKIGLFAGLIALVVVFFATIGRKVINLKKLEFSGISFKFTQTPKSFLDLLTDNFVAKVILKIQNFSDIDYKIEQSALQIYSQKGNLISSPYEPIQLGILLKANANNEIPTLYMFDYTSLITLVKDNGLASDAAKALSVIKNFVTTKKLGTEIIVKGFIVSQGITININQTVTV